VEYFPKQYFLPPSECFLLRLPSFFHKIVRDLYSSTWPIQARLSPCRGGWDFPPLCRSDPSRKVFVPMSLAIRFFYPTRKNESLFFSFPSRRDLIRGGDLSFPGHEDLLPLPLPQNRKPSRLFLRNKKGFPPQLT